jgi:hypothetical protein
LTEVSRWDRWGGRPQLWWVLHSVPLGDGRGDGQAHTDVDHLLIGPPGLVSINTKHHRTGKLYLDGDQLVLNGRRTDYVPKARREADRVTSFLHTALTAHGHAELVGRLPVRPLLAIVGGRLMTERWPAGVTVVMTSTLIEAVRAFPVVLDPDQVAAVYELARRSTTWNPPPPAAPSSAATPRVTTAPVPAPRHDTSDTGSRTPRTPRPEHR